MVDFKIGGRVRVKWLDPSGYSPIEYKEKSDAMIGLIGTIIGIDGEGFTYPYHMVFDNKNMGSEMFSNKEIEKVKIIEDDNGNVW